MRLLGSPSRRWPSCPGCFPGGLALLWDLPHQSLAGLPHEVRAAFWCAVGHLPGLTLHVRDEAFAEHLEGPLQGWFHAPSAPQRAHGSGLAPGLDRLDPRNRSSTGPCPASGRAEGPPETPEEVPAGSHWGELILPLGALKEVGAEDVVPFLSDIQAGIERNLSLRMSAHAWPAAFPFQRRRTGWRVAVLGGREYQAANGSWEDVQGLLSEFWQVAVRAS